MRTTPRPLDLLLLLGSILVALAGAELAARWLAPQWGARGIAAAGIMRHDPLLGWSQRPGSSGVFALEGFAVRLAINRHGLRDRDYPVERPPGTRRVLLLGDSFAWGYGVEHEETVDELVERRYPHLELINAAVAGYGNDQELLYLARRGLRWRPDAVMLFFHPNDFANNLSGEQYGYRKPVFRLRRGALELHGVPVPAPGLVERAASFVRYRTYVPRQLLLLLEGPPPPPPPPPAAPAAELAAALMVEMARHCREAGADFGVFLIPATDVELARRLAELAGRLDRHRIPWVDLAPVLAQANGPITLPHNNHWNARGHRLAAAALEGELRARGLLEPP